MQKIDVLSRRITISEMRGREVPDYISTNFRELTRLERNAEIKRMRKDIKKLQRSNYPSKIILAIRAKDRKDKVIGVITLSNVSEAFGADMDITIPNEILAKSYGRDAICKLVSKVKETKCLPEIRLNEENNIINSYMAADQMPAVIKIA